MVLSQSRARESLFLTFAVAEDSEEPRIEHGQREQRQIEVAIRIQRRSFPLPVSMLEHCLNIVKLSCAVLRRVSYCSGNNVLISQIEAVYVPPIRMMVSWPAGAAQHDDYAEDRQCHQRENLSFFIHLFSLPLA